MPPHLATLPGFHPTRGPSGIPCLFLMGRGFQLEKHTNWKSTPKADSFPFFGGHLSNFVFVALFLQKICGNDISKLGVALFCCLGFRSNASSMDWSPEIFNLHDFWIFGTRRNPYLWIWITRRTRSNLGFPRLGLSQPWACTPFGFSRLESSDAMAEASNWKNTPK